MVDGCGCDCVLASLHLVTYRRTKEEDKFTRGYIHVKAKLTGVIFCLTFPLEAAWLETLKSSLPPPLRPTVSSFLSAK